MRMQSSLVMNEVWLFMPRVLRIIIVHECAYESFLNKILPADFIEFNSTMFIVLLIQKATQFTVGGTTIVGIKCGVTSFYEKSRHIAIFSIMSKC